MPCRTQREEALSLYPDFISKTAIYIYRLVGRKRRAFFTLQFAQLLRKVWRRQASPLPLLGGSWGCTQWSMSAARSDLTSASTIIIPTNLGQDKRVRNEAGI